MFVVAIGPKKSVCELLRKTGKYIAEYECASYDFKQVIKFDEQYLTKTWKTVLSCGFTADDTNKAILEIYGTDDPAFASIMESAIIPGSVEAWTVMDEKKFKLLLDFEKKGIHVVDVEGTHIDIVIRKLASTLDGMAGKSINEKKDGDCYRNQSYMVYINMRFVGFVWDQQWVGNISVVYTQNSCKPWDV